MTQIFLGLSLGISPIAAWIAATGRIEFVVLPIGLGVLFWVAGFDILYSLQDADFDKSLGLHSVPVQFGAKRALQISGWSHIATLLFLAAFGFAASLGALYTAGVVLTAVLLIVEHRLVFDGDLSRLNTAFFTINGWVGIMLLVFTTLDLYR